MTGSISECISAQFYEWEQRGRGWLLANKPIELEPPFEPFFVRPFQKPYVDDGKRPTIFQKFAASLKTHEKEEFELLEQMQFELFSNEHLSELYAFKVSIHKKGSNTLVISEQLLLALSYCSYDVSFEIIANGSSILIQFVCREEDRDYIFAQLNNYLSDCTIEEFPPGLDAVYTETLHVQLVDFGLDQEFMRPITMGEKNSFDPFAALIGLMEVLQNNERALLQIVFCATKNRWRHAIVDAVKDSNGGSFFLDAPEMPKLAQQKAAFPLFAATVRCAAQTPIAEKSEQLLIKIASALINGSKSPYNSLVPLMGESYSAVDRIGDMYLRESRRMGMILNSKELATLVHIPYAQSQKLYIEESKTKLAPLNTNGVSIGINVHNGIQTSVLLSPDQRLKHTHIIGATGTGKSTLLLNLITQDLVNGDGICVIEPHGDLIDSILTRIPVSRQHDVVLIDPSDSDYPIGLNLLQASSDIEKEVLASDLVAAFKRYTTTWGDQIHSVLANAILVFLESTKGGTLLDLKRFLLEKDFRESVLDSVSDPNIRYYWHKQFPLLKSNSVGPILTRLDTFLRPKLIRNMIMQKQCLDFESLLDSKKVILVKLSHGLIGEENSYLLGSFLVSKLHQAALARQSKRQEDRSPFYIYIDEFQHFLTPSMASILSGARKYQVGLTLAHQDLQQLHKADTDIASAVLANAHTRICFRVGDSDARVLEKGFSAFEHTDLTKLSTGHAICRIERSDADFTLQVQENIQLQYECANRESVVTNSRKCYATKLLETTSDITTEIFGGRPIEKTNTQVHPVVPSEKVAEVESIVQKKTTTSEQTQHRYLQTLIKKMAESKGYKAVIEMPTADGSGLVDVHLEQNGHSIACEVSVTTNSTWELHNIKKCIAAGYEEVLLCTNQKNMKADILRTLDSGYLGKIKIMEPEELFSYFDSKTVHETKPMQTKMKGYRVNVKYSELSATAMHGKKQSIAKVVLESLRRVGK